MPVEPLFSDVGRSGLPCALFAAFVISLFGAGPASAVGSQIYCWSSTALRHKPGEERIIRGTRRALVLPPPISTPPSPKSPYPQWKGVLRRVDLPKNKKVVAITFDLCEQPHEVAGYQGYLVDYLRDHNIPATFFAGGKWLLTHPERAQQLISDPLFHVGNHTWDHANLRLLSGSQLDDEIWNAQTAYLQTRKELKHKQCLDRSGTRLAYNRASSRMLLFRFPFGACNKKSLNAVEAAGLRAVQWDVAAADPAKTQTAHRIVRTVLSRARSGSIIIFHANGRGWHTESALPTIIEQLKRKGFKFVTVPDLLRIPGAKPVIASTCYDERPGDSDRYDSIATVLYRRQNAILKRMKAKGKAPKTRKRKAKDHNSAAHRRPTPPRANAPLDP